MSERIARLRAHQRNIGRYENLLKTNLTELELQFLEKRLSEERFAIAMAHHLTHTNRAPRCAPKRSPATGGARLCVLLPRSEQRQKTMLCSAQLD